MSDRLEESKEYLSKFSSDEVQDSNCLLYLQLMRWLIAEVERLRSVPDQQARHYGEVIESLQSKLAVVEKERDETKATFENSDKLIMSQAGTIKKLEAENAKLKERGIEHARTHSCLFVGEA